MLSPLAKIPVEYGKRHRDVADHWPCPASAIKLNLKSCKSKLVSKVVSWLVGDDYAFP